MVRFSLGLTKSCCDADALLLGIETKAEKYKGNLHLWRPKLEYVEEKWSYIYYNDTCNTLGDVQLINEPTRETESTASLIDILITTKEGCIRESGEIKTLISDYYILYAIRKGKKIRLPPMILETRSFKNSNPEELTKDLASLDWSEIYQTSDVNKCAEVLTGYILQAVEKHAPLTTITVKGTVHNMFSDELIALMKERDRARQTAVRSKKAEGSQCSKSSGIK